MVTSTSVLGIKFDGGVALAADTLGSYGSLARYRRCSRILKVNEKTVMGAGGDYADYQFLKSIIEQRVYVFGKFLILLIIFIYKRISKGQGC